MNEITLAWIMFTPLVMYLSGFRFSVVNIDEFLNIQYQVWKAKEKLPSIIVSVAFWGVYFLFKGIF